MELKIYLDEIYKKYEREGSASVSVTKVTSIFSISVYNWADHKAKERAFIKLPQIPSYMLVESAKLHLMREQAVFNRWINPSISVHRVLEEWTEESLKTNTPAFGDTPEYTVNIFDNGWKIFDITQYISDLAAGEPNYGLVLKKTTETASWEGEVYEQYAGIEHSNENYHPYIIITYTKRAPRPPKNLTPTAETRYNDTVIRFAWEHDPTLEDTQSKFDLEWRKEGGGWQRISRLTSDQYYDMPANTLPVGTIYWRVRTYGENGLLSDWTESSFLCAGKSATPIITGPASQVNTSQPVVSWTSESQVYYQIQVITPTDTIYWDSGEVLSTNTSAQIAQPLQNESQYIIRVRTKNQFNIWTDWASKVIDINFGRPAEPSFKLISENDRACIRIQILNPTEANFQDNEVYRRIPGGEWVRIAKEVPANGVVYDWTLEGNIEYEYKVRAFNTEGGFVDSPSRYSSIILRYAVLGSTTNPEDFVWLKYNVERNGLFGRERALNRYAGRSKPVTVFGEQRTNELNIKVTFKAREELQKLVSIGDSGDILLYRDHQGRKMYCTVGDIQTEEKKNRYTASFTLTEVDYTEVV